MAPQLLNTLKEFAFLTEKGWSVDEVNAYIPILQSLSDEELLQLHTLCNITMFKLGERVDREQAIWVLVNPSDTSKQLLFSSLAQLQSLD